MASPPLTFVACTVFESNRTALPRAVKHIKAKTLSYVAADEFSGPLVVRGVARDLQVRNPQCASTAQSHSVESPSILPQRRFHTLDHHHFFMINLALGA